MSLMPFASALANHLWQSTLVVAVAGLLALALRKNRATVRSALWLIASVKFLVPFSLLVAVGGHFAPSRPTASAHLGLSLVQAVGQPFPMAPSLPSGPHEPSPVVNPIALLLLAVWAIGFVVVVLSWWAKWRGIRAAVRAGSPLALVGRVQVVSAPVLLEPGVFGIFQPVLVVPAGIAECLAPAQLQAIMAHELCHVRRRDNLTAAIHMLVEAVFWFHPPVWWLGARLVEERERACDEEVLRLGSEPQAYAESILRTCRFYLESPITCMSGVTGSDLQKRIVGIMAARVARELSLSRKLLLAAAGAAALAMPILFGISKPPTSLASWRAAGGGLSFEVATIKPNHSNDQGMTLGFEPGGRFVAHNITLKALLESAYGVNEPQVSGGPAWLDSAKYDIQAKPPASFLNQEQKLPLERQKERTMPMIQSLLVERCKLSVLHETEDRSIYVLVVAKDGVKFRETVGGLPNKGTVSMRGTGSLTVNGAPLPMFIEALSWITGRVVVDDTGLTGNYQFSLYWTPDASGPSIFTALPEQLGLRLESKTAPIDTLVISHMEKPSEN